MRSYKIPLSPLTQFVLHSSGYRLPMPVSQVMEFTSSSGRRIGFYVCPRCGITLEREYMSYCDRCGQCLDWSNCAQAQVICPGDRQMSSF